MKKAKKGSYGYIRWEKLRRLLTTLLMLALPLAFFTVGMILNKGDRKKHLYGHCNCGLSARL